MKLKGIDISTWQDGIDWAKVKAFGIEFVMIRAAHGTELDNRFVKHIKGASSVGLHIGIYQWTYARNAEQARQEAEWLVKQLEPYRELIDFPVSFDMEDNNYQGNLSPQTNAESVRAWQQIIEAAGYYASLYANKYWLTNKIGDVPEIDKWVAQWADACTYAGSYTMWQYTSDGNVQGIPGRVDMNEAYFDYPFWYAGDKKANPAIPAKPVIASPAPAERAATYTVKSSDSDGLIAVARRLSAQYGTTISWKEMADLNSLKDSYTIYVGQALKVPSTEQTISTVDVLARAVLRGDWGNGQERKERLTKAGHDYFAIQKRVNELM